MTRPKQHLSPLSFLVWIPWAIMAVFFCFYYRFSFNYETYNHQQYYLIPVMPLCIVYTAMALFKKKGSLCLPHIALLLLAAATFMLLLCSRYYAFSNEYFFTIVAVGIMAWGLLLASKKEVFYTIIMGFLLLFIYQYGTGFEQWYRAADRDNSRLYLTGTLQNSGIYACYLVIHIPFLYWLFFSGDLGLVSAQYSAGSDKIFRLLKPAFFVLLTVGLCFLVFTTRSRTAYIALFVIIATYLATRYRYLLQCVWAKSRAWFYTIIAATICLAALGVYSLFSFKKMSAFGRLMKLDITWAHITDHFWLGTGLGRFTWYYPQWQAQYFATHSHPPQMYWLNAGEGYILFNEYLQMFKAVGCIGFVAFVGCLIAFFRSKSVKHKKLFAAAKLTVIAILSCGFTSYPLHVNIFLLLLAFCLILVFVLSPKQYWMHKAYTLKKPAAIKAVFAFMLGISLLGCYQGFRQYHAANKWNNIKKDNTLTPQQTANAYTQLYPYLHKDGKFLTQYGIALCADSARQPEAVKILEAAQQQFISRATVAALAKAYSSTHQYAKAIKQRLWLSHYLPHEFIPKDNLLQAYRDAGDSLHVRQTAQTIVTMPVKIPSYTIDKIKREAKEILSTFSYPQKQQKRQVNRLRK